jgi:2-iminobutanoate/2-iminopropanoate deaminase
MAVTDMDAFVAAGELRREFFVARYPVTTTVEVMRLCDRALLVEMSAIAEIPLGRFRRF